MQTQETPPPRSTSAGNKKYLRGQAIAPDGIESVRLLFFWQRWFEALDLRAPVAVQARTAGSRRLLTEWLQLRRQAQVFHAGLPAVKAVEEEAFGSTGGEPYRKVKGTLWEDPVVAPKIDVLDPASATSQRHYAGNVGKDIQWERVQTAGERLVRWLEANYLREIADVLETLLFPETRADQPMLQSEVEQIELFTTLLVTESLARGFTLRDLRKQAKVLEDPSYTGLNTEKERVRRFIARLAQPASPTTVLFLAQANLDFWNAWPTGDSVRIAETLNDFVGPNVTPTDPAFEIPHLGQWRYIAVTVDAVDRGDATRQGYMALGRVADLIWAGNPSVPFPSISAVGTIRQRNTTSLYVVPFRDTDLQQRPLRLAMAREHDHGGLHTGFEAFSATQVSTHLYQSESQHARAARRITGAIRALRLSFDQMASTSRIATMWTALEVLAHESYGPHTIERVVRSVVPFIAAVKIRDMTDDIVAYLAMAGLLANRQVQAVLADAINTEGKYVPSLLLGILAKKEVAMKVVHAATSTPLVAFRVMQYHESVKDGPAIVGRVIRSAQRVDWQIRRLYRLRNAVVHGATFEADADRLLEHLYLYATSVLGPMAAAFAKDPNVDIESIISETDSMFYAWLEWVRPLEDCSALDPTDWLRIYTPSIV